MARKIKRGRNIYRRRKSKFRSIITTSLWVILIGAIGFVGFSVAGPFIDYLRTKDDNTSDISQWTPPPSEPSADSSADDSEAPSSPDKTSEPTTAQEGNIAIEVPVQEVQSEEKLTAFLSRAKTDGYNAVVIQLKDETGLFLYDTSNEIAISANTVGSEMKLADIVAKIKGENLVPIARIHTLKDALNTQYSRDINYQFKDGGTVWLDNAPAKGGKRWISPFNEASVDFICDISDEITNAGFEQIIYSSMVFPSFHNADYGYIGDKIKPETRWTGLIELYNEAEKIVKANKATSILEVSAKAAIEGTEEVYKVDQLQNRTITAVYNADEIGKKLTVGDDTITIPDKTDEAVTTVFKSLAESADGIEIIPCIEKAGLNDTELLDAIKAVKDLGYKSYIIR